MSIFKSQAERKAGLNVLEGPLLAKIFSFAIPIMLTSILQWAYSAADSIVVGKFAGKTALAAVTSNSALINLIVGLVVGLSTGASVVTAQAIGAKNQKKIKKIQGTAFIVAFAGGLLIAVVGVLFAPTFLKWMGSPDDIIQEAAIYLRIYFAGEVFNMIAVFGNGMLRAAGDSKHPLIFAMISGGLNVILNLVLVIVFHLGTIGVAVGTFASMLANCIMVLLLFKKGMGPLQFTLKELKFDGRIFKDILAIGIPAGFQSLAYSLSNTILQSSINSFGSIAIAGNGAATSIDGLQYQFVSAFYMTASTFAGQCVGAKRMDRLEKSTRLTALCTVGMAVFTGTIIFVFGKSLLSIYISDPDPAIEQEMIEQGYIRMKLVAVPYFLCGFQEMLASTLKAMNRALASMIASLICVCGVRLVWIFTVFASNRTPEVLFACYALSWVLACIAITAIYLISKKQLKKKWALDAEKRALAKNT